MTDTPEVLYQFDNASCSVSFSSDGELYSAIEHGFSGSYLNPVVAIELSEALLKWGAYNLDRWVWDE